MRSGWDVRCLMIRSGCGVFFDLGTLTQEDVIRQFQKKHPEDAEVIAWFISHGEYMHVPRPGVWKLVHQLKEAGYKLYILSNYPEKLFKKHTEYADFMADMDGVLVSYMIKKAKPSPGDFCRALSAVWAGAGGVSVF